MARQDANPSCLWIPRCSCDPIRNLFSGQRQAIEGRGRGAGRGRGLGGGGRGGEGGRGRGFGGGEELGEEEGEEDLDQQDTTSHDDTLVTDPTIPPIPPTINPPNVASSSNPLAARPAFNIPPNVQIYTKHQVGRAVWIKRGLGQGATAFVVKGIVAGDIVAIKLLDGDTAADNFQNEVSMLSRLNHPNIVGLYGVCVDGPKPCILYDYMKSGSLDKCLFPSKEPKEGEEDNAGFVLSWNMRLSVAVDIIRGLQYLHETSDAEKAIVHRDLKPANILLDKDFRGRIADLGSALEVMKQDIPFEHFQPTGTTGYMDPAYVSKGQLTPGADIFAFGIILIDMITGLDTTPKAMIEEGAPDEFLVRIRDPKLKDVSLESLRALILLAKDCIRVEWADRPSTTEIRERLQEIVG